MADEELHETTADDQKDLQSADDTAAVEETTEDVVDKTSVDEDQSDDDDLDIPMDRVEAVLNATVDKDSLSPQMQRMMNRQAENTRRVEESIKGTKSNPRWFVPLFCALMIIGLVWAVRLLPDHRLSDSAHRRLEPGHRVRNHHGRFHYDHVVALSRFSPFRLFHRGLCQETPGSLRSGVFFHPLHPLCLPRLHRPASALGKAVSCRVESRRLPADYLLIFAVRISTWSPPCMVVPNR